MPRTLDNKERITCYKQNKDERNIGVRTKNCLLNLLEPIKQIFPSHITADFHCLCSVEFCGVAL